MQLYIQLLTHIKNKDVYCIDPMKIDSFQENEPKGRNMDFFYV
jgi:hypothetical protein